MEFISITIFFALIVGWIEWKSYQVQKQNKINEANIKALHEAIIDFLKCTKEIKDGQILIQESLNAQSEFILKAHTDLGTIVKEYEVNGVPLGYDRKGGKFDYVEGL
jgi:hypothetical protein